MQTEHFTILVGPEKRSFKVPEGRLKMHSPVFERMCSAPFLEAKQRLIKLPEDDPSVFEDFFAWLHLSKPEIDSSKGTEAIFALAIFAEKYQICHLMNQITDLVKKDLGGHRLNPKILDQVYSGVPERAILRQFCSWILKEEVETHAFRHLTNAKDQIKEYAGIFSLHPDLGRDFFLWTYQSDSDKLKDRCNACQFHDHSDIPNPGKSNKICPYTASFVEQPAAMERRASKRLKINP